MQEGRGNGSEPALAWELLEPGCEEGLLLQTAEPEALAQADIVLVFTASGNDARCAATPRCLMLFSCVCCCLVLSACLVLHGAHAGRLLCCPVQCSL